MLPSSELLKSSLHGLIELFQKSFLALRVDVSVSEIEKMSVIIYNVMEARWRKYHSIEHVYSICETSNPIQVLAGLFHDVVYAQVDRRIHPKLSKYLPDFEDFGEGYTITIPQINEHATNRVLQLVTDIFGLKSGQFLGPFTGANEYLSALVAARMLESTVDLWDLAQIIACIELTIPFRPVNVLGETPPEQMERRLKELSKKFDLGRSSSDFKEAAKNGVEVANRDVISFSAEDVGVYVANTWQLILEGNPIFKNPMFTIVQYRNALLKTSTFLSRLSPDLIYHTYNHPKLDNGEIQKKIKKAKLNILLGKEYFQIKLITISILEAIAELSGGDAPLVLLTGQLKQTTEPRSVIVEDFLDKTIPEAKDAQANKDILRLLNQGLYDALSLDLRNRTISSYLYVRLSKEKRAEIFGKSLEFFERKIDPLLLLKCLDERLRKSLINAVAQMATSRRKQIIDLLLS